MITGEQYLELRQMLVSLAQRSEYAYFAHLSKKTNGWTWVSIDYASNCEVCVCLICNATIYNIVRNKTFSTTRNDLLLQHADFHAQQHKELLPFI